MSAPAKVVHVEELDLHLVEMLARHMSKDAALKPVADAMTAEALRKVTQAIREMLRVSAAEERAAWDSFLASADDKANVGDAARRADKMLAERRERFGGPR